MYEVRDLKCPECGKGMKLKYGKHGPFYGCVAFPSCKGSHAALDTGLPTGIPADEVTRAARTRAHQALARFYRGEHPRMSRRDAYSLLGRLLNLEPRDAHIGRLDREQCERLITLLEEYPDVA